MHQVIGEGKAAKKSRFPMDFDQPVFRGHSVVRALLCCVSEQRCA